MKQCTKCKKVKPLSDYHRDKNTFDGHVQRCKECVKIKTKEWLNNNREKNSESCKKRYAANPELYKARARIWFQNNSERKTKTDRNYQINNPHVYRATQQRRKIRKTKNGEYKISPKEWNKIYSSSCVYCGSKKRISVDHVIPISRGGTHGIGNLVSACLSCNTSKGAKTITEWKKAKRNLGTKQPTT